MLFSAGAGAARIAAGTSDFSNKFDIFPNCTDERVRINTAILSCGGELTRENTPKYLAAIDALSVIDDSLSKVAIQTVINDLGADREKFLKSDLLVKLIGFAAIEHDCFKLTCTIIEEYPEMHHTIIESNFLKILSIRMTDDPAKYIKYIDKILDVPAICKQYSKAYNSGIDMTKEQIRDHLARIYKWPRQPVKSAAKR